MPSVSVLAEVGGVLFKPSLIEVSALVNAAWASFSAFWTSFFNVFNLVLFSAVRTFVVPAKSAFTSVTLPWAIKSCASAAEI